MTNNAQPLTPQGADVSSLGESFTELLPGGAARKRKAGKLQRPMPWDAAAHAGGAPEEDWGPAAHAADAAAAAQQAQQEQVPLVEEPQQLQEVHGMDVEVLPAAPAEDEAQHAQHAEQQQQDGAAGPEGYATPGQGPSPELGLLPPELEGMDEGDLFSPGASL